MNWEKKRKEEELNNAIYELRTNIRGIVRECLCLNNEDLDWEYYIKQWRETVSPLFSNCKTEIEGIRIIDPIFRHIKLAEERQKAENIFYLILEEVSPCSAIKGKLIDTLILYYWCDMTGLCYSSLEELVTKSKKTTRTLVVNI